MSERVRANLCLLLAAAIWGTSFVAQRMIANEVSVFLFNAGRFLVGALVLLPFAYHRRPGPSLMRWAAPAGVFLFAASAFQQAGLRTTTAGNAAFITGLYVVLVPLMLWAALRQPVSRIAWSAALLAGCGAYLLSSGGTVRFSGGDGLELAGAAFWAVHVIWVGRAAGRVDILHFSIGQFLICALLNLGVGLTLGSANLSGLTASWGAVAYTGVFSIGVGFTLQALGQRRAPASDAAIILSIESVFAALSGFVFLGEQMGLLQLLGCGLILAAVLLAQVPLRAITDPELGTATAD